RGPGRAAVAGTRPGQPLAPGRGDRGLGRGVRSLTGRYPPAGRSAIVVGVLTTLVVAAQIALAILLGAAIGLERELSAQPAGLRTHMLVALGAVVVSLAGAHAVVSNPATLAAPVITGVGFLGGGAILREGTGVKGLTTAASLWVTAA